MSDFESRTRGKFWKFRLPCAGLFLAAIAGIVASECLPGSAVVWLTLGVFAGLVAFVPRLTWMLWVATALVFGGMHAVQSDESPGNRLARMVGSDALDTLVLARVEEPFRTSGGGSVPRWRARGAISLDAAHAVPESRPNWIPVLLVWQGNDPPSYGDQLRARVSIRRIAAARNPGDFDARAWQRLSGVFCEALIERAAGYEVVSSDPNPLILFALRARTKMIETLTIGIGGTLESSIILGMTIGDTRKMPDEIEDAFREAGVFHLFSVSGLHVGMIAAILWFLMGIAGVDKRKAALILIPCVFFYALVTGLKPASVRAATMIAMVAGGLIFHRQPLALNSLCAAGLIILGLNTNELFNPGFQLSFVVVTAILVIALPLYRLMEIAMRPDPFIPRQLLAKWRILLWDGGLAVGGLVSVSLAAWLGSLPLTIIYFNLVSFAAIPVNILIVPLAFVSLALAAGSVATGWALPIVADLLNHANLVVTKAIVGTVMAFTSVPGGHFYVAPPMASGTVAEVTVMDFRPGGCTVIRSRDGVWLIDGGSSYHGRTTLLRYLRSIGVNEIRGVVLTHGDSRHLGGLASIAARIPIAEAWESSAFDRSPTRRKLRASLAAGGAIVHQAVPGDVIRIADGVTISVVFPPPVIDHALADEKSLVMRLDAAGQRVLFLSDAGSFAESWLLENASDALRADVLVKGYPSDGDSGSAAFLAAVAPLLVIQEAPLRARTAETILPIRTHCDALGIPFLEQNRTGAITLNIRNQSTIISQFLPGGTPIELRRDAE